MGSFGITGWHDKAAATGPGVTIGRSGASIGSVSFIDQDYWPLNTCLYVKDFHGNNPRFAYYLLQTLDLAHFNSGSAQPSLNRNYIHPLPLSFPGRPKQDAIVAVLGALDDKIELNRRMNETMEAIARAIFRDWFVDFGPTRAKMEGREPYLAPDLWELFPDRLEHDGVPQDWRFSTVGQRFDVKIGRTPPRKESWHFTSGDHGVPWLSIRDLGERGVFVNGASEGLTPESVANCRVPIVKVGTVLVSFKLTVGRVAIANVPMATNEAIAHLNAGEDSPSAYFTYCWMSEFDYQRLGSTSSIATAVNSKMIREMEFPRFPPELEDQFALLAEPIFERIRENTLENLTLARTRDLLLPKLMSGEITLTDAEQAAGGVA
jgi:type I restriction enzyme S subunit